MSKPFKDFETELNDAEAEHATFRARVAALLKRLEAPHVSDYPRGYSRHCHICGKVSTTTYWPDPSEHLPDCELAALLRECR